MRIFSLGWPGRGRSTLRRCGPQRRRLHNLAKRNESMVFLQLLMGPIDEPDGGDVTLAIGHAGKGTGKEFKRTLARLFGSVHLPNIENMKEATSESEVEAVADSVHKVDTLGELVRGLLRWPREGPRSGLYDPRNQ